MSRIAIAAHDVTSQRAHVSVLAPRYNVIVVDRIASLDSLMAQPETRPHFLVADLTLHDGDVLSFIEEKRNISDVVPFLIVSSASEHEEMHRALDLGALDYIVAPYVAAELLFKVEIGVHLVSVPTYDMATATVRFQGRSSEGLTSLEGSIFQLLNSRIGTPIHFGDLGAKAWTGCRPSLNTVGVHISHLRRKLGELSLRIIGRPSGWYQLVVESDGM